MQICRLDYNAVSSDRRVLKLHVYGLSTFPVFSGKPSMLNRPDCSFREKAALPPGQYWIVDRPLGSMRNRLEAFGKDPWNGTDHNTWFGLYNFQTLTDSLWVNGKDRGGFRIHPLGPDGSGESHGCITFFNIPDFNQFRQAIIQRKKFKIPGSRKGILAYGRVDVTGTANYEACDV
ncbi:DUF2778 domain-containing protein [Serratia entomophila]|uniref:DUF2778 domain-containing protein n=1 Tax=Serratia entomophila TaxID=42906 RepID=UPI00217A982A|nr:DUF2778 domain-containing protein [Serratia entomophila]CAI0780250.1 Protein of uncharacterised function (DUF2778) [Serratia entomophila]CAI0781134.1 Protein of uncharacterised function (DUF2778) [Serratia entomophila]CAI0799736.1 Protein of uncharacterised function (DUF2778) [Serratia entomophila]CAI1534005.1 Protein of uncharacterised function (DUF2778) [Serratia entomophila]CAI1612653.1 Protein of uncharacterised function (DUF2778) [Serratia entomophila]